MLKWHCCLCFEIEWLVVQKVSRNGHEGRINEKNEDGVISKTVDFQYIPEDQSRGKFTIHWSVNELESIVLNPVTNDSSNRQIFVYQKFPKVID